VHGSYSQSSTQRTVDVQGAVDAAAASDARMFHCWQAIRGAQHAAAPALVNEMSWQDDASELPVDWQLLSAVAPSAAVNRPIPAAAAGIALADASQLLERCTVLSSKKQVEPCCICLDDVAVNALVPLLYCGHRRHRDCLLRWLTQRLTEQPALQLEQAVVCPMCKQVSVDRRLLCSVGPG
jgi:hypothetical protein